MTPDQALVSHRRMLAQVGEDVIVRRYSGTGEARTVMEAVARARIVGYLPQELVGAVQQGDRKVILLNDPAAAVPSGKVALATLLPLDSDDQLVIRGAEVAIQGVDDSTRRIAGVLVALEIQVRG
ncbi:hypothetical protein ACMA5K_24180 [Bradyrhizobium diazoefficiens]|uniref:hypothetical protein n=1 Tax=Bradyrhizobium diazoefficiens TaxID=1355477 RepID=UPI000BE98375|nr:hypothetical protein [Bradyrhizobium diazoefficiens]PDT58715.1 hypothetical protein CO678_26145 [Bradyrhizobium diazoefficiens]QLD43842.1 hypothetical protein HUW42_23960 [Bradyrhizobium diazoefficiens]